MEGGEAKRFRVKYAIVHCLTSVFRCSSQHEWELIKDRVYFHNSSKVPTYKEIPSMQLIIQTLGYARELERIV